MSRLRSWRARGPDAYTSADAAAMSRLRSGPAGCSDAHAGSLSNLHPDRTDAHQRAHQLAALWRVWWRRVEQRRQQCELAEL